MHFFATNLFNTGAWMLALLVGAIIFAGNSAQSDAALTPSEREQLVGEKCLIEEGLQKACNHQLRTYEWQEVGVRIACCVLRNTHGADSDGTPFEYPACCDNVPVFDKSVPLNRSQPFFTCKDSLVFDTTARFRANYLLEYEMARNKAESHCRQLEVRTFHATFTAALEQQRKLTEDMTKELTNNTKFMELTHALLLDVNASAAINSTNLAGRVEALEQARELPVGVWVAENPATFVLWVTAFGASIFLSMTIGWLRFGEKFSILAFNGNLLTAMALLALTAKAWPLSITAYGCTAVAAPVAAYLCGPYNPLLLAVAFVLAASMKACPKVYVGVVDNVIRHIGNNEDTAVASLRIGIEELYRKNLMEAPTPGHMSTRDVNKCTYPGGGVRGAFLGAKIAVLDEEGDDDSLRELLTLYFGSLCVAFKLFMRCLKSAARACAPLTAFYATHVHARLVRACIYFGVAVLVVFVVQRTWAGFCYALPSILYWPARTIFGVCA